VALVSGGASGIGNSIARMLYAQGIQTVVADTLALQAAPPGIRFHKTDISSAASVAALYDFLQTEALLPDLIVCSAGRGIAERLAEGDPEKWQEIINLNLMGHLRTLRAFLPQMLEKEEGGDVVLISSVAARKPYAWGGIYAASKAALQAVAESLRLELQPRVRVSTVLPGVVNTSFFENMVGGSQTADELGWGSLAPEDVAEAVRFIISRPPGVAVDELVIRPAAQPF
jgi:NADP-dependent 3-hydroxy acid dehydrogenase YdfG